MKNFYAGLKDWAYHSVAEHPMYTIFLGVTCFFLGVIVASFTA